MSFFFLTVAETTTTSNLQQFLIYSSGNLLSYFFQKDVCYKSIDKKELQRVNQPFCSNMHNRRKNIDLHLSE